MIIWGRFRTSFEVASQRGHFALGLVSSEDLLFGCTKRTQFLSPSSDLREPDSTVSSKLWNGKSIKINTKDTRVVLSRGSPKRLGLLITYASEIWKAVPISLTGFLYLPEFIWIYRTVMRISRKTTKNIFGLQSEHVPISSRSDNYQPSAGK